MTERTAAANKWLADWNSAYLRDVIAPQMRAVAIGIDQYVREVIAPAMQETCAALNRACGNSEVESQPTDQRERALRAVRSRGTGPAAPRLDGRRR